MKSVQDLLGQFLDQAQLDKATEANSFFSAWRKIAGEDLAAHSRIQDVVKGIVYVEADHPGWMQMLQFQKRSMMRQIQRRYPELEVRDMRFFLNKKGDGGSSDNSESVYRVKPVAEREFPEDTAEAPSEEQQISSKEWIKGLEDDFLKTTLLNLKKSIDQKDFSASGKS